MKVIDHYLDSLRPVTLAGDRMLAGWEARAAQHAKGVKVDATFVAWSTFQTINPLGRWVQAKLKESVCGLSVDTPPGSSGKFRVRESASVDRVNA